MQNLKVEPPYPKSEIQSQTSRTNHRAASVWKSFGYAFDGIWHVFRTQRNAKIHAGITLPVILIALFLRISATQWAVLVVTIGLVLSAEMFNTVIEAVVDLVSPEFHPLAKIAKDVAAGAVLLVAVVGVIVGLFVLGPPLWHTALNLLSSILHY